MRSGLGVFVLALLIASPWFIRNWRLYGDPLGMSLARQTIDVRAGSWTWGDTAWLSKGWCSSFWGKFGGAGHIPMARWVYVVLAGVTVLAVWGLIRTWFDRGRSGERVAITLLGLVSLATAVVLWRYSLVALGTDQGRLLFPAASALVGLFVLGLLAWASRRWRGVLAMVLVGSSLLLGLYGLLGVIRPAYAPPASATYAPSESNRTAFGDLVLVGWELGNPLTLYWQRTGAPDDWRGVLRVVAEDGTQVWERRRSPGGGQWSSDHWPPGYTMRDVYALRWPEWAGPGRYRVEVGAYPVDGALVVPTRAGEPATDSGQPFVFLGWLDR